jgi:hypothetical protein
MNRSAAFAFGHAVRHLNRELLSTEDGWLLYQRIINDLERIQSNSINFDSIVAFHLKNAQQWVTDNMMHAYEMETLQNQRRWDILEENPKIRVLN